MEKLEEQETALKEFSNDLEKLLEKHNIDIYAICVKHPKFEDPILRYGNEYESAQLANKAHKLMIDLVMNKIN